MMNGKMQMAPHSSSAYVDGATINGNNFCSQNAVNYFRNGYEDSSDDDSKSKKKSK